MEFLGNIPPLLSRDLRLALRVRSDRNSDGGAGGGGYISISGQVRTLFGTLGSAISPLQIDIWEPPNRQNFPPAAGYILMIEIE